jgi:hypothetical protein
MSLPLFGIVSFQFFAGGLALVLAVTAFRRRGLAGWPAVYFGVAAVCVAIYSWGYALEISSHTLDAVLAWSRLEYVGIPFIMPAWLLFGVSISGHEKWITRGRVLALLVVPLVTLTAALTTEWHPFYYIQPHLDPVGPFFTLDFQRGPLYWLNILYDNAGLVIITVLLAQMLARSAPPFRWQAASFLLGTVIQWAGLGVYVAGYAPYNLDLSSLTMSLSALVFAIGLFRYRGLDVVPLARDVIFERMGDGVLVLDALDRLIDFNAALQAMLPELQPSAVGLPASQVLAAEPLLLDQLPRARPGRWSWRPVAATTRAGFRRCSTGGATGPARLSASTTIPRPGSCWSRCVSWLRATLSPAPATGATSPSWLSASSSGWADARAPSPSSTSTWIISSR